MYEYVEAELKGWKTLRRGVVISETPLVIRGISGREYLCVGEPKIVSPAPEKCSKCGLKLFNPCERCKNG